MSYTWIWLLIPIMLWFYSGLFLVRFLGPGFDEWRGSKYLKPYWNLLTLFAGPVMALVMWGYQFLDLIWLLIAKLFGGIFGKLKKVVPSAPPPKSGTGPVRLLDSRGDAVTGDDPRTTSRARDTLRKILAELLDKNLTDLVMEPKPNGICVIQAGQKGKWVPIREIDAKLAGEVILLVKIMAALNPQESGRAQVGKITIRRDGAASYFTAETTATFGGEKLLLHRKGTEPPMSLDACGFSADARKTIHGALSAPAGVILIAAPPDSGSSTTFRALLAEIDTKMRDVITVEDSADAMLPGIVRREPGKAQNNSFPMLTTAAVQESPTVLGLDRLADAGSARTAFDAAREMLLIFTIDAPTLEDAVQKLESWGVSRQELAARLRLAIVQRRLRKLCKCRRKATPAPEIQEYFNEAGFRTDKVCAPAGCRNCGETGFLGVTAVFDLCGPEGLNEARGNTYLAYEGFRLASEGIVSVDEVERAVLADSTTNTQGE